MAKSALKQPSRYRKAKGFLIFWTLFIGIGAVAGSFGMLSDPSGKALGMDEMLPYFKVLPFADVLFRDLTFSGFALLIVNGLTNLVAAVLLFCNRKTGVVLGGIFGCTLMLWICIQFYMFLLNFMSTAYFIFGLCQAVTGYCAYVFRAQEEFSVSINDYPNIGTNGDCLVVFFSRMGYTRKVAYEISDSTGSDIFELDTTEPTDGTAGFWWCGRFAMQRSDMELKAIPDIKNYSHITIVSPIWFFSVSSPIRAFCRKTAEEIRQCDFVSVHHTRGKNKRALFEVEELLQIKMTGYRSFCCRLGKINEV